MPTFSSPQPVTGAICRWRAPIARRAPLALVAAGVAMILTAGAASAAVAPRMGTTSSFAVLAGAGITNTGATVIDGDVGSYATTTITGFDTVTQNGVNHAGDLVTQGAKQDLIVAYDDAAGAATTMAVGPELGGLTLTPGVYTGGALQITGTLTLDTLGNPDAVFIFQAASTLTANPASAVVVLNGARACNVYWQVTSSATLGTTSRLIGNVLALTDIHARTGATVQGRLLARNGEVTLQTNTITDEVCATTSGGSSTTTSPSTTSTTTVGTSGAGTSGTTDGTVLPSGSAGGRSTGSGSSTGLANTGLEGWLPLAGFATVGVGMALVYAGRRRDLTDCR